MRRPPPIVLLAIGYGAGLATGLARFPDPAVIAAVLVMVTVLIRHEWWWPLLPAIAAGTLRGAHAASIAADGCASHRSLGDREYRVHTVDPGEGAGRVRIVPPGCSGVVVARWPATSHLPAGAVATITARWIPRPRLFGRPDGLLAVSAIGAVQVAPSAVERVRNDIVRTSHQLFGPRAPLVRALVAGWRGELEPELRQAFAAAGAMHLLAISGLHVACLAGWVLLCLRLCRVPRHPAEFGAPLAALGYVAFLGWPAAATRAVSLLLLVAACRARQRHVRIDALLAASALVVVLVDPWGVIDVGAWLSVLGVSGLVAATRWSDAAVGSAWWVRSVSGSTGALLATAPVAAAAFGQVAPIGIVLNVAAAPLLLLTLPVVSLPLLLIHVLPAAARALAAAGNGLLAVLDALVRLGATAPGAGAPGSGGVAAAMPWVLGLLAAIWVVHRRTTLAEALRRLSWIAVATVWIVLVTPRQLVPIDHRLTLLFVDVGQGDAALVRTPLGHWMEVDAGPSGDGWDAGSRVIAPLLLREGVRRVDLFVLSHAHRDHVGGGAAIARQVPVALALEPGELFSDSAYDGWLAALATRSVRWRSARAGEAWSLDGVGFRVLHPPTPWAREGEDLNEDSVVLEVTFGNFRALFMGDAGFVAESAMAATLRPVDVLKVGHHGSRTASSAAFLAAIRPQVAVISVGRNRYGHPAPETLARFDSARIPVWRTDQDGTVRITTDGSTFSVTGARGTVALASRH